MTNGRNDTSGDFTNQALLVRLDERVASITKRLESHNERINKFAEALSDIGLSARDIMTMQRGCLKRIDALDQAMEKQQDAGVRIRQQRLVLFGTALSSLTALLVALITAYLGAT